MTAQVWGWAEGAGAVLMGPRSARRGSSGRPVCRALARCTASLGRGSSVRGEGGLGGEQPGFVPHWRSGRCPSSPACSRGRRAKRGLFSGAQESQYRRRD